MQRELTLSVDETLYNTLMPMVEKPFSPIRAGSCGSW